MTGRRLEAAQVELASVGRDWSSQPGRHPRGHRASAPAVVLGSWSGRVLPQLLLPLGVVRFLMDRRLGRVLAVRPKECSFWRAMVREVVARV